MVPLLQRAAAIVGVVVMIPVALNLYNDRLSAEDAGFRAGLIFIGVVGVRRLLGYLWLLEKTPVPIIRSQDPDQP